MTATLRYVAIGTGACWWLWLLHFGHIASAAYDWHWHIGYLRVIQEALAYRVLPLYRTQVPGVPWYNSGDAVFEYLYWANPKPPLVPQLLLLAVVPPGIYTVINFLLFYGVGCAGLLAIARRYRLSTVPFLLLLILFYGNGYIVSHLFGWHPFEGYLLLPWFFVFVLRACEGDRSLLTAVQLGLVLAVCVLHGSFHPLLFASLFLLVLAIASWRLLPWAAGVGIAMAGLGAIRLVPIAAIFPFDMAQGAYFGGYDTYTKLWDALVGASTNYTLWWEYDAFVGFAAAFYLAVFGLLVPFATEGWRRHLMLLVPMLVLAMWSTDLPFTQRYMLTYLPWYESRIPGISMERIPSRFIGLPLACLIVEASIALQWAIERWRGWVTVGTAVLVVTAIALHNNAAGFRPLIASGPLAPASAVSHVETKPARWQEYANPAVPDACPASYIRYDTVLYRRSIALGATISLVAALSALLVWRRARRSSVVAT